MVVEGLFPVIWRNLRHPESVAGSPPRTTEVVLQERYWRHIVETHICDHTEPWSDVLGIGHVGVLRTCSSGPFDQPPAIDSVRSVTGAFGSQIEASLSLPLALTYESLRSDQRPARPTRKWHLITPCGAVAIVTAEAENLLRTAYFSGSVSAEPSRTRWREAVRTTVQEYAVFDPTTKRYTLPESAHARTTGDPPEYRHRFRYILPGTWGFAADTTGAVWSGVPNVSYPSRAEVSPVPSSLVSGDDREPNREGDDDV
jgi:hypothetical protein